MRRNGCLKVQIMSPATVLLFVCGLMLLIAGAEVLIRGASRLAAAVGISPLVIGLTVVAFGTSSPELAVSIKSAFAGQAALGLGNLVGSNICNILLVLGIAAMISPLVVHVQIIRVDMWVMTGAAVLTLLLALDGYLGRFDGLLLAAAGFIYTAWSIRASRKESAHAKAMFAQEYGPAPERQSGGNLVNGLLVLVGLGVLIAGAELLVNSATTMAKAFGLSELVIGLTVVAIGTSMPEVATSVIASLRGQGDIGVGNLVGSSVYNLLAVLGMTAAVSPAAMEVPMNALKFDMPVMIACAVICLPVFTTGARVVRLEGLLLVTYFVAYTGLLLLESTQSRFLPTYRAGVTWVIVPLSIIPLTIWLVRGLRRRPIAKGEA